MVFLFRAAFWLFIVFMLLPPGSVGGSSPAAERLAEPVALEANTLEPARTAADVGSYCLAHAPACRAGLSAAALTRRELEAGLSMLDDAVLPRPPRHLR